MHSNNPSNQSSQGLGYYWLILKHHWIPAASVFFVISSMTLLVTSLKKPMYLAEGLLRLEKSGLTSSVTESGKEIANLEPLAEKSSPMSTEAEVIRSNPVIEAVLKKLDLKDKQGKPLKQRDFLAQMKVAEVRGTDVLKITYTDANPETAAKVVNVLMGGYLENVSLSHRTKALNARQFIEQQLPSVKADVNQAEEALRRFRETNQVIAIKEESSATVVALSGLRQQMTALQAQIVEADGEAEVLRNKLGMDTRQALSSTVLSQSPGVQAVLKDLQQAELELAAGRSQFQDENPEILILKAKLAFLNQVMQERVTQVMTNQANTDSASLQMGTLQQDLTKELVMLEKKRQGLAEQLLSLSEALVTYQRRSNSLPGLEKEQRELDLQLEASQITYSQLLKKIAEIRVSEHQNNSNIQIISLAQVPDKPTSSKNTGILAALMMGVLAAAATVYVLQSRSHKAIKTIEQAKNLFGFTLLGVIPLHKHRKNSVEDGTGIKTSSHILAFNYHPATFVSEAYKRIHANLKFLSSDRPPTVIAVTSSVAQEGKSTVSANLALLMAQLGRRVLLVDADMQSPSQHQIWNLPNAVGLSNILLEKVAVSTAVQVLTENLNMLTSGDVPPNSMALLDSEPMAKLVEIFGATYDVVIIDTPPLGLATDALAVGKLADGVLLVVRPGYVDMDSATYTKMLLEQSGQHVIGQVINGVTVKGNGKYAFAAGNYSRNRMEMDTII
jgi:polysaccharide biosynthesis transport protein